MARRNFEVKHLYVVNPGHANEKAYDNILKTVNVGDYRNPVELTVVRLGDKRGVIDYQGDEIVPAIYDDIAITTILKPCEKNLIKVTLDGKVGFLNLQGEELLPCEFESVLRVDHCRMAIVTNDKHSIKELNGVVEYGLSGEQTWRFILPMEYKQIIIRDDGFQISKRRNLWGFADLEGNEVVPCQYNKAFELTDKYNVLEVHREKNQTPAYDFCTQDGTVAIAGFKCERRNDKIVNNGEGHFSITRQDVIIDNFHIDFENGKYCIVYD